MLDFSTENTRIWRLNELEGIIDDFKESLKRIITINYKNSKTMLFHILIVL